MAWTTLLNAIFAAKKPILGSIGMALRDNLFAAARGLVGAPYVEAGWHPYNGLAVGDGFDGLLWDFAVTGTFSTLDSPAFADGYEYRLRLEGVSASATSALSLSVYREVSAEWVSLGEFATLYNIIGGLAVPNTGCIVIERPRITSRGHLVRSYVVGQAANAADMFDTTLLESQGQVLHNTAQRLSGLRITASGGQNAGKIFLDKRRVYA